MRKVTQQLSPKQIEVNVVHSAQRGSGAWQLGNQGTKKRLQCAESGKLARFELGREMKTLLTTEGTLLFWPNLPPNFSF